VIFFYITQLVTLKQFNFISNSIEILDIDKKKNLSEANYGNIFLNIIKLYF